MSTCAVPEKSRAASRRRLALVVVAAVAGYATLVDWVLQPVHAAGSAQGILSFLNGLNFVVQAPGLFLMQWLGPSFTYRSGPGPWFAALALNLALYAAAVLWFRRRRPPEPSSGRDGKSTDSGKHTSRRTFLRRGLKLAAAGAAAGFAYGFFAEPRWFRIRRQAIALRGLPVSLDGLRAVHLTDVHLGPWISAAYVRKVIDACNDLAPDLMLLTGDYVHLSPAYIPQAAEELARLRPRLASLAVLGNHDWWNDPWLQREGREASRLLRHLRDAGIDVIDNTRRVLDPQRSWTPAAREGLAIAGVGDLWEDTQNYPRALGNLPETMPRLLLSHNPDVAEASAFVGSGLRVDLMLSGHTHGGQVSFPGFGPPLVPSRFGQKYARGLNQGPVCPVFTCTGIGLTVLPMRLGVPPEIAVLEFRST